MQSLSRLYLLLFVLGNLQAQDQKPALAWSAQVGENLSRVIGTSFSSDGDIFVSALTRATTLSPVSLYVGKLSRDGNKVLCSSKFEASHHITPYATTAAPDGTVFITGYSNQSGFSGTEGAFMPQPSSGDSFPAFLIRLDPCSSIKYVTYLPAGLIPVAIQSLPDAGVLIAAQTRNNSRESHILRIDPAGQKLLADISWPGSIRQIKIDPLERILVTGQSNDRILITRYSANSYTQDFSTEIPVTNALARGTAIASASDGSIWVGGITSVHEGTLRSPAFQPGIDYFSGLYNISATLTILDSNGSLRTHQVIHRASGRTQAEVYIPGMIQQDQDDRMWIASEGSRLTPQNIPEPNQVLLYGSTVESFTADGHSLNDQFFIPQAGGALISLAENGFLTLASMNQLFPKTSGSAGSHQLNHSTLIGFHLKHTESPVLISDRSSLEINSTQFSNNVVSPSKEVHLKSSNGLSVPYTASIIDGGSSSRIRPEMNSLPFQSFQASGTLPVTIPVHASEDLNTGTGILVVLAPGTQGVTYIPLLNSKQWNTLELQLITQLSVPSAGHVANSILTVQPFSNTGYAQPQISFSLSSNVPWLRFEKTTGVAPKRIRITADSTGLDLGIHEALITAHDANGRELRSIQILFSVGAAPFIKFPNSSNANIPIPTGKFSYTFRIESTDEPFDFTIESRSPWIQYSPLSGTTPQTITATLDLKEEQVGSLLISEMILHYRDKQITYRQGYSPSRFDSPAQLTTLNLVPGGLFYLYSRKVCSTTSKQTAPWPNQLGGCTLRVNGQPVPIGEIKTLPESFPGLPTWQYIIGQLPQGISPGPITVELEDSSGSKTAFQRTITSTPFFWEFKENYRVENLGSAPVARTAGEKFTIKLSGMGDLVEGIPTGEVPSHEVLSKQPVIAYVGGIPAQVIRAAMSRTDVGIFEVEIEVPNLSPDRHPIRLKIGEKTIEASSVDVFRENEFNIAAIQNSSSYHANEVSPGGIVTIYGSGLGFPLLETFQLTYQNMVQTYLTDRTVRFNGISAPVLYTSENQMSVIAPFELEGQTTAEITVSDRLRVSKPLVVPVKAADPGIFSLNQQGTGPGAILNQDSSVNTPENPAKKNSVIALFGSGFGAMTPRPVNGSVTALSNFPQLHENVAVTVGGVQAHVEYAGPAPGAVAGLYQVNVRIPSNVSSGNLEVKVAMGTSTSQDGLTVAIVD